MKWFIVTAALMVPALMAARLAIAADEPNKDDRLKVMALPPHPLDKVFEKAATEKQINEGLLNDDLFKKAVKEALKAKKEQEQRYKDNPTLVGASPAQAARVKFLEMLRNETKEERDK